MNTVPAVTKEKLSNLAENFELEKVVLILGIGVLGLAYKAMENGYAFNFSYTKGESLSVSLNPPSKTVS